MKRASADVGLMLIAYNFRRIGNILTIDRLREYLRILILLFSGIEGQFRSKSERFATRLIQIQVLLRYFQQRFVAPYIE
jgi:hypothetical protein